VKRLPVIGEPCPVCRGWISRQCACGGRPDPNASIDQLARWLGGVDRATKHGKPSKYEVPRKGPRRRSP
jgi:hypothetical protein